MVRKLALIGVLAAPLALYVACGEGKLSSPTSPTGLSSAPTISQSTAEVTGKSSFTVPYSPNSCPDAGVPRELHVNVKPSGEAAVFLWYPEPGILNYEFTVQRYNWKNTFQLVTQFVDEAEGQGNDSFFYRDWRFDTIEGGIYRVRIRTRSACQTFGPWSDWVVFSQDNGPDSHQDPPRVAENPTPDPVPEVPSTPGVPGVPPVPPAPPAPSSYALGSNIEPFAILAGSAITCTTSTVTGDIGVSPGSSITGFPGLCSVSGAIRSTAFTATAKADLDSAYASLSGQPCSNISSNLNGVTLTPGTYCVPAATSNLSGTLTLSGTGGYTLIFSSTFITSAGSNISATGGASCGSINYVVASSATLKGTSVGNVIAFSSITMNPGATHTGRVLARNAAVTMTTATLANTGCN